VSEGMSFSGTCASMDDISCDVDTYLVRNTSRSSIVGQHSKYRQIIVRIALYPIVSLFLNISNVLLDLKISVAGSQTSVDFHCVLLDLILYGLRTLVYGLIAATDPAFLNALRAYRPSNRNEDHSVPSTKHAETGKVSLALPMRRVSNTTHSSLTERSIDSNNISQRTSDTLSIIQVHMVNEDKPGLDPALEQMREFERHL